MFIDFTDVLFNLPAIVYIVLINTKYGLHRLGQQLWAGSCWRCVEWTLAAGTLNAMAVIFMCQCLWYFVEEHGHWCFILGIFRLPGALGLPLPSFWVFICPFLLFCIFDFLYFDFWLLPTISHLFNNLVILMWNNSKVILWIVRVHWTAQVPQDCCDFILLHCFLIIALLTKFNKDQYYCTRIFYTLCLVIHLTPWSGKHLMVVTIYIYWVPFNSENKKGGVVNYNLLHK